MVVLSLLVACQPKAAPAPAEQTAAPVTETPDVIQSLIDHLTSLSIPKPDMSPDQILNPEAKMNPPESLEGSGIFPDNYFTADVLHTGARGCMSCHADLYTLVKNLSPKMHVASHPTYGKPDDVKYCLTCHQTAGSLTGGKFGDIIHAYHSYNELFEVAYNGDCWSCHAIDVNGEMALYDFIKYDASFAGGFPGANNDDVLTWMKMRGFETGYMTGFDMVADIDLEIVDGQ
jgi:hypothetical protein